jgi:dTDP-4-dehydrorhamnose reductase
MGARMTPASSRVLVLGASGLLGAHLVDRLPLSFETVAVAGRRGSDGDKNGRVEWLPLRIDAADASTIGPALAAADAHVVVNAIGAAPTRDEAVMADVNARFPHALAAAAEKRGMRVVHISTDAVFSGARGNYSERDAADANDEYGRSKLAGELAAPHLTIRTSFYGRTPRGTGLIEWLVRQRGQTIDGFADYRFTGVAAPLLADLITAAIGASLGGVYHVGGEPVTKHELLSAVAARMDLDVRLRPVNRGAIDRTLDSTRFFAAANRVRPTIADSMQALTTCGVLSRS